MKKIAILGSTGSIGTQTVDILPSIDAEVVALTTNRRINLLEEQARALHPKMVCAMDEDAAKTLENTLADTNIEVLTGMDGLIALCRGERRGHRGDGGCRYGRPAADDGGHQGRQGHCAGEQGDAFVCAGGLVMSAAKQYGVRILPVDSGAFRLSSSACRRQTATRSTKILLTAPAVRSSAKFEEMRGMTREQALHNPNWSMGAKITIDSATMMNKGLELIEAMWLYDLPPEDIEIIVHRESIVHSAVEFGGRSGNRAACLPDMRLPIQLALTGRSVCRARYRACRSRRSQS